MENPFKIQMKTLYFALILLIGALSFLEKAKADVTTFDCSNGQCVMSCGIADPGCTNSAFSVNPTPPNCSGYNCPSGQQYSSIIANSLIFNPNSINVNSNPLFSSQNIKMTVQNGAYPGQSMTINLNAKNAANNASSALVIGDNFDQVNVNLNGYSGQKGKDATELCAEKIQAGDYGSGIQTFFNSRRSSNPALNPSRCDFEDLNYMQQFSFSCDDPAYSEVSASNPTVSVQKIREKARCSAIGSYSTCVKRKVTVNCGFKLWSTIKNRWLTENDLVYTSWVGAQPSVNNGQFSSTGSCSTNYEYCTTVTGGITGGFGSPSALSCVAGGAAHPATPGNPCSSGQVLGNQDVCTSGMFGLSCTYGFPDATSGGSCNVVKMTNMGSGNWQAEFFKRVDSCEQKRKTYVPLERTNSTLGPYDESFVNSESNRLGGLVGFCQAYGGLPAVSDRTWFGGIVNPPFVTSTVVGSITENNEDTSGIPFEDTRSVNNLNWQAETNAQHGITGPVSFSTNYTCQKTCQYGTTCTGDFFNQTCTTGWNNPGCTENGQTFSGTCNISGQAYRASIWKANATASASNYTSPGLDSSGVQLAVGSIWSLLQTNTFEACPSDYSLLKNNYVNLIQYANDSSGCSSVTDPLDPNRLATWQYTGMAQEVSFGTQNVSCSIGTCAVNSSVSDLARNLDVITPGDGENGTQQGRGLIFAYDLKTVSTTANPGTAGVKGSSDILVSPQVRICAKIDDATAGINTDQAKNPFVSFRRYSWQAVKSNNGGNEGNPPQQTGKKIEIFKKLDPAVRYFLDKNLL